MLYTAEDAEAAAALTSKLFPEPEVDFFQSYSMMMALLGGLDASTSVAPDDGSGGGGGPADIDPLMIAGLLGRLQYPVDPAVLEPFRMALQPAEFQALSDALSIPGMTDVMASLLTMMTANGTVRLRCSLPRCRERSVTPPYRCQLPGTVAHVLLILCGRWATRRAAALMLRLP